MAGGEYGHGPINLPGLSDVVAELNSQLENVANADIPAATTAFDENAASAIGS